MSVYYDKIIEILQKVFQVRKYKNIKILWISGISCPKLEPPDHGVRFTCTNEWYFGSVCSLECESGYTAVDGSHIMCHFSKTWTRTDFVCKGLSNVHSDSFSYFEFSCHIETDETTFLQCFHTHIQQCIFKVNN